MATKLKDRLLAAAAAIEEAPDATTTREPHGPATDSRAGARTAPGAMLAGLATLRARDEEVAALQAKLDTWVDAQPARRLDPRRVDVSAYANRDPSHYHGEAWEAFRREIAASNGNVQAVLVRPKEEGRHEIVFGHRRRQACSDEALPLLAVIAEGIGDQLLFQLMERENRSRVDLSPYEQGQAYAAALDRGLYASLRQLAAAIDRDPGIVSRYLAIARLPAPVLHAFSSRTKIQKRWGEKLSALQQDDPEGLLARARTLSSLHRRPSDAEVFRRLCDAPSPPSISPVVLRDASGKEVATVRRRGASSVEITLKDAALTDEQLQKLVAVLVGQP